MFIQEDPWEFEMLPSNDAQSLDVFEYQHDSFSSDTMMSDDEVVATPPPSSPDPYTVVKPDSTLCPMQIKMEPVPVDYNALVQMRNSQLAAHYQQLQQYQLFLQQNLLASMQTSPFVSTVLAPANYEVAPDSYPCAPVGSFSGSEPTVQLTSLDPSHFGTAVSTPKLKAIPVDISVNLSDSQYNKIFKKYHLQLQLDSHPVMTEQDLEDIRINGRMYFLKNVKTIVPKVGPWKFNAHISHRRTDERQYNIPGMAVTCKVKEWLTDDGLWRMYHYKRGKTIKPKIYD
jgi:hypothetical protein